MPELEREVCRLVLEHLEHLTARLTVLTATIAALSSRADMPTHLQKMPGVGPIAILTVEY